MLDGVCLSMSCHAASVIGGCPRLGETELGIDGLERVRDAAGLRGRESWRTASLWAGRRTARSAAATALVTSARPDPKSRPRKRARSADEIPSWPFRSSSNPRRDMRQLLTRVQNAGPRMGLTAGRDLCGAAHNRQSARYLDWLSILQTVEYTGEVERCNNVPKCVPQHVVGRQCS